MTPKDQQCRAAGVACFVKQLGKRVVIDNVSGLEFIPADSKGGDPAEWPTDMRVRELPTTRTPTPIGT